MLLVTAILAVDDAELGLGLRVSARPPRARAVNVVRALRRDTSPDVADTAAGEVSRRSSVVIDSSKCPLAISTFSQADGDTNFCRILERL